MKKVVTKTAKSDGYSLLELIITMAVLAVLVLGTIPLVQNSVKRQKEQRLRESLAMMRLAIDEFKRDAIGACPEGSITTRNPVPPGGNGLGGNITFDPRSRVVIDDCKIFDTENLDRFPPTLDILFEGVKVKSRTPNLGTGKVFGEEDASELNKVKDVTKVYLREIPIDPMTGEKDTWKLRSPYQDKDSDSWDDVSVFDVRSGSDEESFNGEKYSDW
jgi:prepilin-type N-terminal cleavage/methylation domain-containing protein